MEKQSRQPLWTVEQNEGEFMSFPFFFTRLHLVGAFGKSTFFTFAAMAWFRYFKAEVISFHYSALHNRQCSGVVNYLSGTAKRIPNIKVACMSKNSITLAGCRGRERGKERERETEKDRDGDGAKNTLFLLQQLIFFSLSPSSVALFLDRLLTTDALNQR